MKLKSTFKLILGIILLTLISFQSKAQVPTALDTGISITEWASVQDNAVRLVYDQVTGYFLYSTVNGNIYKLEDNGNNPPKETLLFTSKDHGIPFLQGMAIRDSLLVVCGNINAFKKYTTGRVSKAKLNPDLTRTWKVLAQTEPYESADFFDHLFSGIVISLNGDTVIWCSGSRGDHGEIQDYYGQHPGLRNLPITSVLLALPFNSDSVTIKNDSTWLAQNDVIYAKGTRNFFDFDYSPNGSLFALENSGDRDDPDEMNEVIKGAHYGFPWTMGGNQTPQQFIPFNPKSDKLINRYSRSMKLKFFHADTNYPKPPLGVVFKEGVKNYGPDADYYREYPSGLVKKASDNSSFITTFSAHRSPLGLLFDRNNEIKDARYSGKGFMLSWTEGSDSSGIIINGKDTSMGCFVDESQDLVLIEKKTNSFNEIQCTRLVRGFKHPIDLTLTPKGLFVIENGQGNAKIYRISFEKPNSTKELVNDKFSASLFPNPCRSKTTLSLNKGSEKYNLLVKIHSTNGQLVFTETTSEKNLILNTTGFNSGIYLVSISKEKEIVWHGKLLVE